MSGIGDAIRSTEPGTGTIFVTGMSQADGIAFEDLVASLQDQPDYSLREPRLDPRRLGEPATLILELALGVLAARTLAAYLLKRRTRSSVRHVIEVHLPSGEVRREIFELEVSNDDPPDRQTLEALSALLDLPLRSLEESADE